MEPYFAGAGLGGLWRALGGSGELGSALGGFGGFGGLWGLWGALGALSERSVLTESFSVGTVLRGDEEAQSLFQPRENRPEMNLFY